MTENREAKIYILALNCTLTIFSYSSEILVWVHFWSLARQRCDRYRYFRKVLARGHSVGSAQKFIYMKFIGTKLASGVIILPS